MPYLLDNDGKSVLVPRASVYDLRLSLAGEGLPQTGTIGYEIFDRTNLGISDFVQKVNYRRAMEGELARTILTIEEVDGARVHLVVPEHTLFREDEKPTTASVVLKLKSGKPLRRETVQGITHLVASSVEGLASANVTIVDSKGELLSDPSKPNSLAALTATQYELQQKVEQYLSQKAQRLLETVVGAGNAIVQVNADLDFRQVDRTLEQYDPDKTTIRSEQITEEKTAGDSTSQSSRNSTVTNYEVNKSVEHIVEGMGTIKRLSVATVVNGIPKTVTRDGVTTTEYTSRPKEEMTSFTELVKKAVGFNDLRNDEVTVTSLFFGTSIQDQDFMYKSEPLGDWTELREQDSCGRGDDCRCADPLVTARPPVETGGDPDGGNCLCGAAYGSSGQSRCTAGSPNVTKTSARSLSCAMSAGRGWRITYGISLTKEPAS